MKRLGSMWQGKAAPRPPPSSSGSSLAGEVLRAESHTKASRGDWSVHSKKGRRGLLKAMIKPVA